MYSELSSQTGSSERRCELSEFLERCTRCGVCADSCAFLKNADTPGALIAENSAEVFLCTNCGACSSQCPEGLSLSEAFLLAKARKVIGGSAPAAVERAVRSARRFAAWGHAVPFACYTKADTVFWPGCALAGRRPDIVNAAVSCLGAVLKTTVGIALDCCFDPSCQVGDLDTVRQAAKRIQDRIQASDITLIITGCANCNKIFSRFLPDIAVRHILEVLPADALRSLPFDECYLHHPCPSYRFDTIQQKAMRLLAAQEGVAVSAPSLAACCGLGGGLNMISEPASNTFADEIVTAAGDAPIITYCMGCKGKFLRRGKETYHFLEFLPGVKPELQKVSEGRKWLNRLLLAVQWHGKDRVRSRGRRTR